nr:uncharacterized protein LOC123766507 [Procambarus clarkii]XP_045611674.1 uncharacterized protein LOC123766507 [Procambarus clarkii]XP_045611675.1 uncharacterized protein LOC123766507 [Procambarus clarkii]XP_045611676.1 uncharacterized protein LOC123766507 [Procambarus clarkii]
MVINLPKRRTIEHVLRSTMAEYPLSRSTRREMRLWLTGICLALLLLSLWTAGSLPSQPPATRAHLVKSQDLPLVFPVIEENLIPGNMLVEIRSKKTLMEVTPHSPYSIRGQLAYLHRSPPPTRLHFNPDVSPWTPWGPKLETISDYFRYLRTPQTSCRKLKRLGGTYNCKKGQGDENNMDGHKYVCMDPSLEVVGAKDARGCLTLSFGTQMDTSFDKAVSVLPCEVHMFDVLDFDPPLAKFNDNVYFHAEGLARMKYSVHFHNINKTATMDTLKAYFFKNKLYPRPIHILKVDIENGEWEAFKDIAQDPLFDAVGQLAMEVHATELVAGPEGKPPPNVPREKWLGALQERYDVLRMIEARGFRRALYWDNVQDEFSLHDEKGTRYETSGEVLYVNTNWYNTTFKQYLVKNGFALRELT